VSKNKKLERILTKKKKESLKAMKKIGSFFAVTALVLICSWAQAANVKVEASVDRNQMGIGDAFNLVLTVKSDEDFELSPPPIPKVAGLELINAESGGRQSSSSMSIINGKTQFVQQTAQSFIYTLSPQKEGVFLIPVIDVKVGGLSYKTNPIKIEAKEEFRNSRAQPKGRPRFPPGYGGQNDDEAAGGNQTPFAGQDPEDLFEQLLQQQQRIFGAGRGGGNLGGLQGQGAAIPSRKLNINTNEAFFVYLDVDKEEVYEGEQITANWYIYTRANIESLDRAKFPDLKGFWKEIIEEVPSLQFTEEIVNGVRFRKALLASHALFPIKAGTSVIDEFRIKAKVRMPTEFGWGQLHDWTKSSRRAIIKVLPLPLEGRTQSFSGAVGTYQISLKTDGTTFPSNQPFSIKVRYEGIGNAKLIDLPNIKWPDGLEVYDTKSDSKFFKEGNSYKEFEILVIPRKEGELKIPPLEFTYFDPAQKKYVSQSTQELTLQITKGTGVPVSSASTGASTQGLKPSDAEFKTQALLQLPQAGFSLAASRWFVYAFLLFAGVGALLVNFFVQLKKIKIEPEFFIMVDNKISQIEKNLQAGDLRKVGSEATNLIYILVANLAGQKKADQELHLLINEISLKDQQIYLERITKLFDYFQLLGFSPDEIMQGIVSKTPVKEQVEQIKNLAKEVVAKLKKEDKYNK
jgi:hypothetical protein